MKKRRTAATALSWADEGNLEDIHHVEDGDEDASEGGAFDLFDDMQQNQKSHGKTIRICHSLSRDEEPRLRY